MYDIGSTWGHISSVAEELEDSREPLLRAFAEHCGLVADAFWALRQLKESKGTPDELDQAIRACLRPGDELKILTADGRRIVADLSRLLQEIDNERERAGAGSSAAAGADDTGHRPEAGRASKGATG